MGRFRKIEFVTARDLLNIRAGNRTCTFLVAYFVCMLPVLSIFTVFDSTTDFKHVEPHGLNATFCEELVGCATPSPEKKIISFALFKPSGFVSSDELLHGTSDPFHWFKQGAIQNIRDAKLYYPEWTVRIYGFGLTAKIETVLRKAGKNVEVIRCSMTSPMAKTQSRMMMSRFLAMDDPCVKLVIVRDTDSRFSPRELFAVNEWISSDQHFHVMRDHAEHNTEVLGGMFGLKRGALGESTTMSNLINIAFTDNPERIDGARGEDQSFLKRYIWPLVMKDTLGHDMDTKRCFLYGSKRCKGFPVGERDEEKNFFVGAPFKPSYSRAVAQGLKSYNCTITCRSD